MNIQQKNGIAVEVEHEPQNETSANLRHSLRHRKNSPTSSQIYSINGASSLNSQQNGASLQNYQ